MTRTPWEILEAAGVVRSSSGTESWNPPSPVSFEQRLRGDPRAVRTHSLEIDREVILVALRAAHVLDPAKLAAELGADPKALRTALAVRVRKTLGFEPGFESIVTDAPVRRFLDVRVMWRREATITTGTCHIVATLEPKDLLAVSGATLGDYAVEPDPPDKPEREPEHEVESVRSAARSLPFPIWVPAELLTESRSIVIRHIGSSTFDTRRGVPWNERRDVSFRLGLSTPAGEVSLWQSTNRLAHERAKGWRRQTGSPLVYHVLVEREGTWIDLLSAAVDERALQDLAETLVKVQPG